MRWFRVYDEVLDDPKIQRLHISLRWRWLELLCIASRQAERGTLPDIASIAFHFRVSDGEALKAIRSLIDAGLIDEIGPSRWRMHAWDDRQFKSDDATGRWQKHSASKKANVGNRGGANVGANVGANGAQTSPARTEAEAETDTEADTEAEAPPPPAAAIHSTDSPLAKKVRADAVRRWQEIDIEAETQANEIIRCWGAEIAGKALDKAFRSLGSKQRPWNFATKICREGLSPESAGKQSPEAVPVFVKASPGWNQPRKQAP